MSQRLFIAVWAEEIADRAAQLQRRLKQADADVRWVATDQLHLTVKFLGETPLLRTAEIFKSLAQVAQQHAVMELRMEGAGAFPDPLRPRTLWIGMQEEGAELLRKLHADVDQAMADIGFAPERRFHPHATLGRVRSQRNTNALAQRLQQEADFQAGTLAVTELVLCSSQLQRDGPIYDVLGRVELAE